MLFSCSRESRLEREFDRSTVDGSKVEKFVNTYKFAIFYTNDYVDTVFIRSYEKVESYSYEGTNYIVAKNPSSNSIWPERCSNYLSTTAPIKDLNRMDLNSR